MKPEQIAKESESSHQKAFFAYCAVAANNGFEVADAWAFEGETIESAIKLKTNYCLERLKWIHHIPNGGKRDKRTAANLKAEGVRPGVPDIFLPWPSECAEKKPSFLQQGFERVEFFFYCGLYIEMKKPSEKPKREGSKGGLSNDQINFKNYAEKAGYKCVVCYNWIEAVDALKQYLNY